MNSRKVGLPLLFAFGILAGGPLSELRPAYAGTTGKITGHVADAAGAPVPWVQVVITEQRLGATSNAQGDYTILNVPPGTHEVQFRHLSYQLHTVREVNVSADATTRIDAALVDATVTLEEVVVTAQRPPVELGLTSTQATISRKEIEQLPVQELDDLVNLQAGVVEGHFRGGRLGEVQYQVDGVSINNAYDNKATFGIDRSLLQEVQVISGTFDAEYGQAMSGVVNAVLREGTEDYRWDAEAYTGGFAFSEAERGTSSEIDPSGFYSVQASVSGPLPVPNTVAIFSARRSVADDYVRGLRRFTPTDSSDFERKIFVGTGDGEEVPLGMLRTWSGIGKITNTSIPNSKIGYQMLWHVAEGRRNDFAFRFNPDGLSTQRVVAIAHGLDWTKTFTSTSFLDVSVRQNYNHYRDFVYEDVYDPRYDAAGPPIGDDEYELGAYVEGVEFGRFRQRTNAFLLKSSYVNQVTTEHQLKAGGEIVLPRVKFGTPGFLVYSSEGGVNTLNRYYDRPPAFPAMRESRPVIGALYAQDQIEWPDLTVRAGVRFDYFDARSTLPSDLSNPANAIQGAPESVPVSTSVKSAFSPRLGVSYPIGDDAALHFAYGRFRQFPAIGEIFANSNYDVLANLQSGGVDYGVLGNPDVSPERTVQYEFGYKHALNADIGVDATVFYKDIRDLLGVEFVSTYNGAEYARLTNADFGEVLGVTLAFDHRRFGPASIAMDYTWQDAVGNASDPRETATRVADGEDPRPRLVPFTWDQRHTLNLTVSLTDPIGYSASAILRATSGQPYTPLLDSGFGNGLEANSGRKPSTFLLDLRGEKALGKRWGTDVALFARAFNVFDARFANGFVFSSTGSPYYSRFTESDRVTLANPTRFAGPRRIEIGLRFGAEGGA